MAVTGDLRQVLQALGTGGTVEMAEGVLRWINIHRPVVQVEPALPTRRIVGAAGVAALVGQSPAVVRRVMACETFPQPVVALEETPIWDRDQVENWASGNQKFDWSDYATPADEEGQALDSWDDEVGAAGSEQPPPLPPVKGAMRRGRTTSVRDKSFRR